MRRERVLIVEDEAIVQLHLARIVEAAGYEVCGVAGSSAEALSRAAAEPPDVVLMDIRLRGGLDGIETALRLRAERDTAVIFVTAHADEATLARAGRALPMGYIVKPFEPDDVRAALATALARRRALAGEELRPARLKMEPKGESPRFGMVGRGPAFERVMGQIRALAAGDWTVLIEGETGTGKELAARAIHQQSSRARGPFVPVNCGTLSETLSGSQLFGHKPGAFTGASREHRGIFESAHGGTLFLDEVAELPAVVQASLLRVLEDGVVQPLGSSQGRQVDFRLLAATHRDLSELTRLGQFRQDLFYRLRVARLLVPPLRERTEDLQALCRHYLAQPRLKALPGQGGEGGAALSAAALAQLLAYSWPGNVRELRSALEHAVIHGSGRTIEVEDLPPEIAAFPVGTGVPSAARPADLDEALHLAGGNHSEAARLLGISRATFYRRLARCSRPAE